MKRSPSLAMPPASAIRVGSAPSLEARHGNARSEAARRLDRSVRFWSIARLACPWRWEAISALRDDSVKTRERLRAALRGASA